MFCRRTRVLHLLSHSTTLNRHRSSWVSKFLNIITEEHFWFGQTILRKAQLIRCYSMSFLFRTALHPSSKRLSPLLGHVIVCSGQSTRKCSSILPRSIMRPHELLHWSSDFGQSLAMCSSMSLRTRRTPQCKRHETCLKRHYCWVCNSRSLRIISPHTWLFGHSTKVNSQVSRCLSKSHRLTF